MDVDPVLTFAKINKGVQYGFNDAQQQAAADIKNSTTVNQRM